MANTAHLPIVADRYGACVRTIYIVGLDLTGVTMRAQGRDGGDTPGQPLFDLQTVTNGNAEGLRLVDVVTTGGIPMSIVQMVINESTIEGLPYKGEIGCDTRIAWDWQVTIAGRKRRIAKGPFVILGAGITGAEAAPVGRVPGYAASNAQEGTWQSARLTFGDESVTVTIDGADLVAPLADRAQQAGDRAVAARDTAASKAIETSQYAAAASALANRFPNYAAGDAATAPGADFTVVDPAGQWINVYRKGTSSGATNPLIQLPGRAAYQGSGGAALIGTKQGSPLAVERYLRDEVRDTVRLEQVLPAAELAAIRANASSYNAWEPVQDVITWLQSNRPFAQIGLHGGMVRIDRMLSIDAGLCNLDLRGRFDFRNLVDECAATLAMTGGLGHEVDRRPALRGLALLGPGRTSGQDGLRVKAQADGAVTHIGVTDLAIVGFDTGIDFLEHAYLLDFDRFKIAACKIGIHKGDGTNAGERITFSRGTIDNCGDGVFLDDTSADFYLHMVSIDYPFAPEGGRWLVAEKGIISGVQVHLEGNNNDSPMGGRAPLRMGAGNTAEISLAHSWIGFSKPFSSDYLFENLNGQKEMSFRDTYLFQARGRAGIMGTGRIHAGFKYIDGGGDHTNAAITSLAENMQPDNFMTMMPFTAFVAEGNDKPATSRLGTATSAMRIVPDGGGNLQLFKKQGIGAGAPASATIPVPVSGPAVIGARFIVSKPLSCSGTFGISLVFATGYTDAVGAFIATRTQAIAGETIAFTTDPAPGQPFVLGFANVRKPAWATHALLSFSLSDIDATMANPGPINIADVTITNSRVS